VAVGPHANEVEFLVDQIIAESGPDLEIGVAAPTGQLVPDGTADLAFNVTDTFTHRLTIQSVGPGTGALGRFATTPTGSGADASACQITLNQAALLCGRGGHPSGKHDRIPFARSSVDGFIPGELLPVKLVRFESRKDSQSGV
jgi:hypothetical protein